MSSKSIPDLPKIPGVRMKHIDGWPGYAVSDDGRVFSCKTQGRCGGGRFKEYWTPLKSGSGGPTLHQTVALCKNGKPQSILVHRLVLEAFVGPCPEGMESCHEDDDALNNRLSNLRWGTRQDNRDDMVKNGRSARGSRSGVAILTERQVLEIRSLSTGRASRSTLAKQFGVSTWTIDNVVHRVNWSWLH